MMIMVMIIVLVMVVMKKMLLMMILTVYNHVDICTYFLSIWLFDLLFYTPISLTGKVHFSIDNYCKKFSQIYFIFNSI